MRIPSTWFAEMDSVPLFANTAASAASTWLSQAPPARRKYAFSGGHGSQLAPVPACSLADLACSMLVSGKSEATAVVTGSVLQVVGGHRRLSAVSVGSPQLHLAVCLRRATRTALRSACSRVFVSCFSPSLQGDFDRAWCAAIRVERQDLLGPFVHGVA